MWGVPSEHIQKFTITMVKIYVVTWRVYQAEKGRVIGLNEGKESV
jgi:hypothetical protein